MRTPARAPRWRLTELRLMGALTAMSLLALTAGLVLERVASTTAAPLVIYVLAYAAGGAFPARSALAALRARRLDVNLLMVTAAIGAAALGHWDEGAALMFLFSLSGTLETYALARTRRAVEALMDLRPETARIDRDGREAEVPIEALVPGDLVIVRPGDRLPVDGDVVQGASAVDESTVTGEATPVDKQPGDRVFATTLNRNGVLRVRATARASESTLARIVRLVEEAEDARPRAQRLADRVGPYYTMAVFGGALLVLLATRYVFQFPWNDAVYRAMMVLVVASPCAVMIPIPAAVLSAIANAALRGIVFKGGDRLEAAARIRVVAFDKTGTITRARAALSGLITLNGASEAHTLQIAAAVEQHSEHPLAVAVVEAAAARGLAPLASSDF
ncbi:MAG: HAD-IC family P-type ATPase, partial [Actinobacteria bacterium]|nr:HAD-IC family P-type ATPase [Actinomycetota bacterium]